jgi:drug/metabolite transporter (DMT)-like permease
MQKNTKISGESLIIHFKLHFIVLILGFSAIFGKLINLPAIELVFFRTIMAVIFLAAWALAFKKHETFEKKAFIAGMWVGLLLAAHWITFFHAIKVSNVSVTLGCLGSSTLFAAFFEPLIDKRKINLREVLYGLIIIAGIYIIFRFEFRYAEGIIYSVISAVLAAMFSVFNKHLSYKHDYKALSLSQLSTACVITLVFMLFSGTNPVNSISEMNISDAFFLFLLASVGTAYAYTATISVIQKLNAYAVILAINMEPVYGILLASLIFGDSELMTGGFYLGAIVILAAVILYSISAGKAKKKASLNISE